MNVAAEIECKWCPYRIIINPRGGHGKSNGNGYDAAVAMRQHVQDVHGQTWHAWLHPVTR